MPVLVRVASVLVLQTGVAVAFLITRSLLQQPGGEPEYAAAVARRIADGDLTVDVKATSGASGSLLEAMKTMQQLAATVRQIKASTETIITTASSEISSGNADLSQRTEQQASSLEETASSMEEPPGPAIL